jgi:hypothetical protein
VRVRNWRITGAQQLSSRVEGRICRYFSRGSTGFLNRVRKFDSFRGTQPASRRATTAAASAIWPRTRMLMFDTVSQARW